MLTLTRSIDSPAIQIGDDITLYVTQIRGNQVRVSLDAPADITILRGELLANQKGQIGSKSPYKKSR
jgi:carbon storage regulator CsrA